MKIRVSHCFILIFIVTGLLMGSDIYQQVRVYYSTPSDLHQLSKIGIPLDHVRVKQGVFIDVVATGDQVDQLRQAGFRVDILHDDLTKFFQGRFDRTLRRHRGFELGSMGGNYTYDEMVAQLDSLQRAYPALVSEKISIGLSVEGRHIWAVKVSDHVSEDENRNREIEPQVLYTGVTHAREPLGMMNLIYFINYLGEQYGVNDEVTRLVDNRELWFVPVLNPDGYVYNQSIAPAGGGMHRKNRRDTGCGDGVTRGVDLNRNYSYDWGLNDHGSSPEPCRGTFRGDSAFSEPETIALRDFMLSHHFRNVLHYHAYSDLLIHSYGTGEYPPEPDLSMLREFGAEMTKFNRYRVGTGLETVGYEVNGDAADYSYGALGLVSYIPEVGTFDDNFWPPTDRIVPLSQENVHPNLYFAWIAGTLLEVTGVTTDPEYVNPGNNLKVTFRIKNAGLRPSLGPVTVTVTPLNDSFVSTPFAINLGPIEARETVHFPLVVDGAVAANSPLGCSTGLLVNINDSDFETYSDTVSLVIGTPSTYFSDGGEGGMENWESTQWGLSPSSHGGGFSITDSPGDDYQSDATAILTMKEPLDLSGAFDPVLAFWARWRVETGWDFVQVEGSTDGSTWIPLAGRYTRPGSGYGAQPSGEPGYDGAQRQWVEEIISLAAFAGKPAVHLRFVLTSDGYVEWDGFYIDDLRIFSFPEKQLLSGDVTRDCVIDVADVLRVVDMVLVPGAYGDEERQLADLNHDTQVDVFDVVLLVKMIVGG